MGTRVKMIKEILPRILYSQAPDFAVRLLRVLGQYSTFIPANTELGYTDCYLLYLSPAAFDSEVAYRLHARLCGIQQAWK